MKKLLISLVTSLLIAELLCPLALMEDITPEPVDAPVEVSDSVELPDEIGGEMLESQEDFISEGDASGIPVDEAHFPDAAFRQYVINTFGCDKDGNLSNETCKNVKSLILQNRGLASLHGIEYFPNLEMLECSDNALTTLDVSYNPALRILACRNNKLTVLDVSACPLLVEIVDDAYITNEGYSSLDGSKRLAYDGKVTLTAGSKVIVPIPIDEAHFPDAVFRQIVLDNYGIKGEDGRPTGYLSNQGRLEATYFNFPGENTSPANAKPVYKGLGITSLKGIEYFPNLKIIISFGNAITSLDLSGFTALEHFQCFGDSAIVSINVSGCTALNIFDCQLNPSLESVDVSGCTNLTKLACSSSDKLKSINIDGCNNLTNLLCNQNPSLLTLDVTNCPSFAERIRNGRWNQGLLRNVSAGTRV